jgi:hypothetical protein
LSRTDPNGIVIGLPDRNNRSRGYEIMRHDPLRSNLALKQKQARNLFAAALANIFGSFYLDGKSRTGLLPRDRIT